MRKGGAKGRVVDFVEVFNQKVDSTVEKKLFACSVFDRFTTLF